MQVLLCLYWRLQSLLGHREVEMPYLDRSMGYVCCDQLPEEQLVACKQKALYLLEQGYLLDGK